MKTSVQFTLFSSSLLLIISLWILPQGLQANPIIDSLIEVVSPHLENKDISTILNHSAHYSNTDLNMAIAISEFARNKAIQESNASALFTICREQGYYYEMNNRLVQGLIQYEKALSIANQLEKNDLRQTIYTDIAIAHRKKGNYKKAKDYHTLSLQLAERENDLEMIEYAQHGLGFLYETVGDYEKAIKHYLQSVTIAESRGNIDGTITTLENIGLTYAKLNDKERSLESIEKAYQLAQAEGDSLKIANVLNDHGEILLTTGNEEEALQKFRASLDIYKTSNFKPTIARSLINIAEVYVKQNKFEMAQRYFFKSLEYNKYIRSEDYAKLYNKLGILYYKQGDLDKSKESFERSLDICLKNNFKSLSQDNHQYLYDLYKRQEKFAKALLHLEASNTLKDSLLSVEKTKRIAEMQFKYDIAQSDKEINALQLRQQRIILIGLALFFSSLLVVLIFILKLRGNNNRSLTIKNEEIEAQNIKLRESNEVHRQFTFVAAHDLKEPLRNIGSFINLLERRFGPQFNDEAKEYMAFIKNGVIRLDQLLRDLLAYSELSSENPKQELSDLTKMLTEIELELGKEIKQKNAVVNLEQESASVWMSKPHLKQLMMHLISNGLKFNKDKNPVIKISCIQDVNHSLISIQDNGIGINKEYQHKIYNLFHRLDRSGTFEGTGIGLTICKNIVDKYDGKLWFDSALDEGTTFYIRVPNKKTQSNLASCNTPASAFSES